MPADNAYEVVHDLTRLKDGAKYGCYNREGFRDGYYAPDRMYQYHGAYSNVKRFIPHGNSTECRSFRLWNEDPMCEGCTAPKDYEYRDRMLRMK